MGKHAISEGLKFWLLFLIGFYLLGYGVVWSIALGAIGGIAGGIVSAWWFAKPEWGLPKPKAPKTEETAFEKTRRRLAQWRAAQQRQDSAAATPRLTRSANKSMSRGTTRNTRTLRSRR